MVPLFLKWFFFFQKTIVSLLFSILRAAATETKGFYEHETWQCSPVWVGFGCLFYPLLLFLLFDS